MPRTHTIRLDPPVSDGQGGKVAEITLREPTLGEMDKALAPGTSPYAQAISLIRDVGGVSDRVASAMPASVRAEALDFFNSFAPSEAEIEALALDNPHVLMLPDPVEGIGGAKVSEVTLREPTLSELDKAMKSPTIIGQMVMLVAQTGGLHLPVARRIPYSRMGEIGKFFAPFL